MPNFNVEFEQMKEAVKAAQSEIVMAVMFHETWKPTAYDDDRTNGWAIPSLRTPFR